MTENSKIRNDALTAIERVATEVIAPAAATVDQSGAFPEASIDALGKAGLLGLISAPEVGGLGADLGTAVRAIERIARACGSTAMTTTMHYCGTAVVEAHGDEATRRELASGTRFTTLAFSESGSRSHFWAPVSTATAEGDMVRLDARKSWITSASRATDYVWSSRPTAGSEASTLWLVPANAEGIAPQGQFHGMGLRGEARNGQLLCAGYRLCL